MRRTLLAAVLAAGLVVLALGCAGPDYDTLVMQYGDAQENWREDYRKAREESEKEQAACEGDGQDAASGVDMSKLPPHPSKKFVGRFEACAKRQAGEPEAIPALAWIISNSARGLSTDEAGQDSPAQKALRRLTEDHAAHVAVKDALPSMRWAFYSADKEGLTAFYEKVIDVNEDEEAKAGATYNLALVLYQSPPRGDEDKAAAAAGKKRAETLFRKIVEDYSEMEIAKQAEGYIFEIEHLQIGLVAPDFSGKDVDGNEIKLSQFRGQVVVLDFWGFW